MIDLTAKSESRSRTFKDVHVDSWAYEIRFLKDKQVIKGFSNNNFKPLTTLTCKDATIMIVRALKLMLMTHPNHKIRGPEAFDGRLYRNDNCSKQRDVYYY